MTAGQAPRRLPSRDPVSLRQAFDEWWQSRPPGWQDAYTIQGAHLVAFMRGWDARMGHDIAHPGGSGEASAACPQSPPAG